MSFWMFVGGCFVLAALLHGVIATVALGFGTELFAKIADALIVASVLAVGIDRYTKRRLAEDVARDISPYAVGVLLPPAVRLEIAALLQTTVLRENFDVTYHLHPFPDKTGYVRACVRVSFDVRNLSNRKQLYTFLVQAERSLFPDVGATSIEGVGIEHGRRSRTFRPGSLLRVVDKGNYLEAKQTERVPPAPHEPVRFWAEYTQIFRSDYTDVISVGHPTVGMRIRFVAPGNIAPSVTFSKGEAQGLPPDRPREWSSREVFLPGQHARLWWTTISQSGETPGSLS